MTPTLICVAVTPVPSDLSTGFDDGLDARVDVVDFDALPFPELPQDARTSAATTANWSSRRARIVGS